MAATNSPSLASRMRSEWFLNSTRRWPHNDRFIFTYLETAAQPRRVTVTNFSDSLERELSTTGDQSASIYGQIHQALPRIHWFDTVTNLRLFSDADNCLQIYPSEDWSYIIDYPQLSSVDYLNVQHVQTENIELVEHLSGFTYRVCVHEDTYAMKEVPDRESVDKFLYEVHALHQFAQLVGLVIRGNRIVGLLTTWAERGALDEIISKSRELSWSRREKWARQIVRALHDVHLAGFVHGDVKLDNIVVDRSDNAVLIDYNRRGCAAGWEPPELLLKIERKQTVSIYMGVKTDLFQLGMVLWGLAAEIADPDLHRPLSAKNLNIPEYFQDIIDTCLQNQPHKRESTETLLARFA